MSTLSEFTLVTTSDTTKVTGAVTPADPTQTVLTFEWEMTVNDLSRFDHMITAPGCCVRAVAVSGMINSGTQQARFGVLRGKIVVDWDENDLPSTSLHLEAIGDGRSPEDDLHDVNADVLVVLDPAAWRRVRSITDRAVRSADD